MPAETIEEPRVGSGRERAGETAPGVVLEGVPWDLYAQLRGLDLNARTRMTYLDGTLILMSPEYIHDRSAERLGLLVRMVAAARGLEVAGSSTTTLRRPAAGRLKGGGKEPDGAFYLGAHARLMGKKQAIDLEVDPPPDLAIEVDHKSDSQIALPVYARIGVPEVWRFDARRGSPWFGRLVGEHYETIDRSIGLPWLTPGLALDGLNACEDDGRGESAWLLWLLDWARGLPEPRRPGSRGG